MLAMVIPNVAAVDDGITFWLIPSIHSVRLFISFVRSFGWLVGPHVRPSIVNHHHRRCVGSIRTIPSESYGNDFHKRSTSEWTRLLCQPADRRSRSNGEQHSDSWHRLQYHCVDDQANAFGIEIVGGAQGVRCLANGKCFFFVPSLSAMVGRFSQSLAGK